MKTKVILFSLVIAAFALSVPIWGLDNTISLMTEDLPPYQFEKSGEITGAAADVVHEICNRIGHEYNTQILPWSRAVNYLEQKENTAVFCMARTEQRENLYKWVGPIIDFKEVMYAKKGTGLKINTLDDAKAVKGIGVNLNSASHQFLVEKGFKNVFPGGQDEAVKMLLAGRLDLWLTGDLVGIDIAKKNGLDPAQLEMVYVNNQLKFYIAFNKNTPMDIIKKWQKTLDDIKADGTYNRLLAPYM
jgi:polar amino acid transport system substrate-binding protein